MSGTVTRTQAALGAGSDTQVTASGDLAAFLQAWGEFESPALAVVGNKPTRALTSRLPGGLGPGLRRGSGGER